MPDQREWQKHWSSLTVAERVREANQRPLRQSLIDMQAGYQKRRKQGPFHNYDIVPSFIDAYLSMVEESKVGTAEERGVAKASMKSIYRAAKQNLSKRDFERFKKGIK